MITDFHAHAFPDDLAGRAISSLNNNTPRHGHAVLDGTLGALLASMDRAGIERAVLWSIATKPTQLESIIRWSLSVAGPRIVPFGSVHPDADDPAADVRRVAQAGLRGIKLHPLYQDFVLDGPRAWPIYEAIAETGLILGFHAGRDIAFPYEDERAAPRRILRVHEAFPGIPIVAAHLGGWRMWDEVAETLAGTNVYLETSYTFGMGEETDIEKVLDRHPIERILFGTDSPWRGQSETMQLVRHAFPDTGSQDRVLSKNSASLIGNEASAR